MKKKSNLSQKTASPNEIYFVAKNGIKVYPVSEFEFLDRQKKTNYSVIPLKKWYIEVNNNGKIHRFEKKVSQDDLNEALAKTIMFYYNKLKEKK